MGIVRHKGVVRSTGSRVYVVWRECPDDPEHCLVVYQDSLPDAFSVPVNNLVNGIGQNNFELWKVMHEVGIIEGGNMLSILHKYGYIRKQNTVDIDMHIGENRKIALNLLNSEISQETTVNDGTVSNFNPYEKQDNVSYPEKNTIVKSLMDDGKKYEQLSKDSYERAYNLEPSLRPSEVPETEENNSTFTVEFPKGISQTKAIEHLKSVLKEQKDN